jgi:hypothetical protein
MEAAPSARFGIEIGTTAEVEVNWPELLKLRVPDPTTVEVPVPPVTSVDGMLTE